MAIQLLIFGLTPLETAFLTGLNGPIQFVFPALFRADIWERVLFFPQFFKPRKKGQESLKSKMQKRCRTTERERQPIQKFSIFNFQFPKIFQAPNSMLRKIRIRQKNSSRKSQEMRRSLMENGFLFLPPKIRERALTIMRYAKAVKRNA